MKKLLPLVFVSLWLQHQLLAQCILNSGFEQWDSTFVPPNQYPVPVDWKWSLPNICNSGFLAIPDTSSYSGSFSAKLETQLCTGGPGGTEVEEGRLFSGGPFSSPRNIAFPCTLRPTSLTFQYKFHQEGNDSGYVKVMLFNYDSITPGLNFSERIDTVAFSSGYMNQEIISFSPFVLPINYLSADTPAFIQILFSTSKTLSENLGNSVPYVDAYPGTTLWLDDVHITTIGMAVNQRPDFRKLQFFPNPARNALYVQTLPKGTIHSFDVFEISGKVVLSLSSPLSNPINLEALTPGSYFIRCSLTTGEVFVEKLLIQ